MAINVLSLFDGMSGCQIALDRLGLSEVNYYASEIDKWAIQITQKNYPNTIQLGDVQKWREWDLPKIDLLVAGSPCQGFSMAGKMLNFDDPRSKLFFDFVDILKAIKPRYFLLENVKMKPAWRDIISEHVGVEPIEINSALVSAQNRKRLYWTNIPNIEQPEDKKIFLSDVVINKKYTTSGAVRGRGKTNVQQLEMRWDKKTNSLTTVPKDNVIVTLPIVLHNLYGGFGEKTPRVFTEKSPTIRTASGRGHIPSWLLHSEKAIAYMNRQVADGRTHWDFLHHSDIQNEKSAAVVANFFKGVPYNVLKDLDCIRKFHPIECERLQTVPDNYTEGVSNTQRYKMLGNGFTVDVIAHILKNMEVDSQEH